MAEQLNQEQPERLQCLIIGLFGKETAKFLELGKKGKFSDCW